MSDMRFKDFLSNQDPVEQEEIVAVEETEAPQEVVEQEVVVAESRLTLEDRMRAKGFVIPDDIDQSDFYDQAIDRIAAGTQAMQEAQNLRAELERIKSNAVAPAAPAAQAPLAPEAPVSNVERMFLELKEYDPNLASYVERDESGRAVPKAAYGSMAVDAAKVINDYEQAERRQAQLLLRNPHMLIKDSMGELERLAEEKAQAIVEKRLSAWQEEQQRAQEEISFQTQAERERAALSEFHETNKSKLFHLGSDGKPLRMPLDQDQFSTTPTGRYFMQRYNELHGEMPGVPQLKLLHLAMREAELAVPPVQKAAVVETATPAEKRQKFVEQRNDAAILPHQNTPPASGAEGVSGAPRLRFADMLRRIPENQDVLSGWNQ